MSTNTNLPVQIGTRRYAADLQGFGWGPTESLRQMQDTSREPNDGSFNSQGLWKRTQSDFIQGAGQNYLDQEDEADRRRFRKSKGVDVWDRRQVKLLPQMQQRDNLGTGTTGDMIHAGDYFYAASGDSIARYDTSTTTPCTGEAGTIKQLEVVGGYVYASGTSTLRRVAVGSTAFSTFGSLTPDVIGTGGGRLVGGEGAELYEIDNAGAKVAIYTHFDSSGFEWKKIIGAPNGIYCFGDDSGRSLGFLLTVVDATGALASPYPVLQMPDGEFIRDVLFFGGVLVLATNLGFRLATINGSGFLTAGPLVEIGDVECLCTDGRDIWFGWTNYDATDTGLGRMRPERFTDTLVPAYSSDVMFGQQGNVRACISFEGKRYFLRDDGAGDGFIYEPSSNLVPSGTLYSGIITYGSPEDMGFHSIEGAWDALPVGSSIQLQLADSIDGTPVAGGVNNNTTDSTNERGSLTNVLVSEQAEVVATLTRSSVDTSTGPTLRRWTIRAIPMPYRTLNITLAIMLQSQVEHYIGNQAQRHDFDPYEEFTYLNGLMENRTLVDVTIGDETRKMLIDYFGMGPDVQGVGARGWTRDQDWIEGTWTVRLLTVEPVS
jgi:hypothetical protein